MAMQNVRMVLFNIYDISNNDFNKIFFQENDNNEVWKFLFKQKLIGLSTKYHDLDMTRVTAFE